VKCVFIRINECRHLGQALMVTRGEGGQQPKQWIGEYELAGRINCGGGDKRVQVRLAFVGVCGNYLEEPHVTT
jgi:hypothetical protein